ncbi:MAG: alpha/beta hydrolase [Alphaproteobacteria bacterium]
MSTSTNKTSIHNFYEHPPQDGQVKQLIFLLHGLGSNGRDLIALAPYFAAALPQAHFVSPDAPFACDMAPPGYPDSYQWFSLQSRDPRDMLMGVRHAVPVLHGFMRQQMEHYNVTAQNCALVGFSQGTMTSLSAAFAFDKPLAGVLGYSGALLWDDALSERKDFPKPPVHLIHGEADDVVPVGAFHTAKAMLEGAGVPFSGYTVPGLPHSIDEGGIASGAEFLKSVFNR